MSAEMAILSVTLAALFGLVHGHGNLLWPLPRGGIDRTLPEFANGTFPAGRYNCQCVNGSSPCVSAQSCLWFENGCTVGCPCSGNGTLSRQADYSACEDPTTAPTNNDPRTRSLNRGAAAGSKEDVYQFMPWRSPGSAITTDPCGIAGGSSIKQNNGGEYLATKFARQGALGSKSLPAQPHGVVWHAGSVVQTSLFIKANHAGGWQYRLCPADEELTEKHVLPFEGTNQILRFADGSKQVINGTYLNEGTTPAGSTWVMNPIPECCPTNGQCERQGLTCGSSLSRACYSHQCGTDAGLGPSAPVFPWPTSKAPPSNLSPELSIVDSLRLPADLKSGDWVLQWRWDAEETAQVWYGCADVSIQ